jgi:hypothetical protein
MKDLKRSNSKFSPTTRNSFRFSSFNYDSVSAMISRNAGQAMVGLIIRLIPAMGGKTSRFVASQTKQTFVFIALIAKCQGFPGLVKYLKTVAVHTQQYLGGHFTVSSPRVSRTNSGIPRMFPPRVRNLIRASNLFFIQWSLTIASLYRDVKFEGPLKLGTIINPYMGDDKIFGQLEKNISTFVHCILSKARLNSDTNMR